MNKTEETFFFVIYFECLRWLDLMWPFESTKLRVLPSTKDFLTSIIEDRRVSIGPWINKLFTWIKQASFLSIIAF